MPRLKRGKGAGERPKSGTDQEEASSAQSKPSISLSFQETQGTFARIFVMEARAQLI